VYVSCTFWDLALCHYVIVPDISRLCTGLVPRARSPRKLYQNFGHQLQRDSAPRLRRTAISIICFHTAIWQCKVPEANVDPSSHIGESSALLLFCQEIIKSGHISKPKTPTAFACSLSRLSVHDRQILTSFKQTIDMCVCLVLFTIHTRARAFYEFSPCYSSRLPVDDTLL
jgi:hypothetical protein